MTDSVFNSTFEMELRVLLLMSAAKEKCFSLERYMFSELASRRARIQEAIKKLVVQGLLDVGLDNGYVFSITDVGNKFIKKLKSEYAVQYKMIASNAIKRYKDYSDLKLDRMIHDSAVKSVQGGQ